mmetsp:Transcript_76580/g.212726  ORF Transcript_76580/g.212726 Transcript_76580/m.212726 type:complete len:201 (-) Transcript_76580:371-973(-)
MLDRWKRVLGLVHSQQEVEIHSVLKRRSLDDTILDIFPSLRTQACLAIFRQELCDRDLLKRRPSNDIFVTRHMRLWRRDASDLKDRDRAAADSDVQAKLDIVYPCIEHVEALVDFDAARRGTEHRRGHRTQIRQTISAVRRHDSVVLRALRVVDIREVNRERVPVELDDVTMVIVDELDQRREEFLEALRQHLSTVAALC